MQKRLHGFWAIAAIGLIATAFLASCDPYGKPGYTGLSVQGTNGVKAVKDLQSRDVSRAAAATTDIVIGDGILRLDTATVDFQNIEFELKSVPSTGEDTDEFEFAGPYVANLLTQEITPAPDATLLPPGEYEEIEFEVSPATVDAPSVVLKGTWFPSKADTSAAAGIAFSLECAIDEELELKPATDTTTNAMTIDATTYNSVFIAFRMDQWFTWTGFAMPAAVDGKITITDSSDAAFVENFKEAFENSCDYGEDNDHDGVLSESEDDD